jgi:hypothetical protein
MTSQDQKPAPETKDSRREFIKASSTVLAGGAMIGSLPIARAAHTFGSD